MMRNSIRTVNKLLFGLLSVLLISGCLGRSSPEVTYYSLLTMEQLGETQAIASLSDVNLGVGPITIPDSLKRSQVVSRTHGNQYAFDEFNRWVGVLEMDITSVLGDNLGALLGVENVGFFPWMHHFKPTYRIAVDIVRLDGSLDSEAVLSARWTVSGDDSNKFLAAGKSDYRQPLDDASYAALIKAESQLIVSLSREIADKIVALPK